MLDLVDMPPRAPLAILFLHHLDDAVTRHHFDLVRRHNPRAVLVPIVDEPRGALPGAIDVSRYPTPWDTRDKWRSCDTMIYRWFAHRTFDAERYVVLEYDCRCDVDLLEYYRPYLDGDVVVATWKTPRSHPSWHWFDEAARMAPEDLEAASGLTPMACALFTHDALERVCKLVTDADVISELRMGTAIARAGLHVRELGPRARRYVDYHELRLPILGPGLYHPIKAIHHNRRLALRMARAGPLRFKALLARIRRALGAGPGDA